MGYHWLQHQIDLELGKKQLFTESNGGLYAIWLYGWVHKLQISGEKDKTIVYIMEEKYSQQLGIPLLYWTQRTEGAIIAQNHP
jgi:hypothetical protein